jgi:hypothetical protein
VNPEGQSPLEALRKSTKNSMNVNTLEMLLEHSVSLIYSAKRSTRYIWIEQLKLRIPFGSLHLSFRIAIDLSVRNKF